MVTDTRKRLLIETILKATPYTPESAKYQMMAKDLEKLDRDTLFIIKQSQKQN